MAICPAVFQPSLTLNKKIIIMIITIIKTLITIIIIIIIVYKFKIFISKEFPFYLPNRFEMF